MSKKKKSTHRKRSASSSSRATKHTASSASQKVHLGLEGVGIMESLARPVYKDGWDVLEDAIFDVRTTGLTNFEKFPAGNPDLGLSDFEPHSTTQALMLAEHVWLTEDMVGHTVKPFGRGALLARKYTFVHECGYVYCAVVVKDGDIAMFQENVRDRSTLLLWALLRVRGELSPETRAKAYIGCLIESTRYLAEGCRNDELEAIKELLVRPMSTKLIATLFDKAAEERAASLGRDISDLESVRKDFLTSLRNIEASTVRNELFMPTESGNAAQRAFDQLFGLAA
jgi:hypothetical protein